MQGKAPGSARQSAASFSLFRNSRCFAVLMLAALSLSEAFSPLSHFNPRANLIPKLSVRPLQLRSPALSPMSMSGSSAGKGSKRPDLRTMEPETITLLEEMGVVRGGEWRTEEDLLVSSLSAYASDMRPFVLILRMILPG
eukprot:470583-Rhodomonas_salina.2